MTQAPEINRHYATRDDAWGYLAARGFACRTNGWRNGRWVATVERAVVGFNVRVWLPEQAAV